MTAVASTTRYYLSAAPQKGSGSILLTGSRSVPILAASGGSRASRGSSTVTVPGATALGTYFLLACADDLNAVDETNETDNCVAATRAVVIAP